jgi:pimeloyl-ACP methyl ester carboxylesterase
LSIRYNHGNRVLPLTINYMEEREQYGNIWYDALNETSLPVLFIYGPADPINLREKFLQKLRQDLPKIKLNVLSDMTGHYPHFEDCFTVFQLISKFLKI